VWVLASAAAAAAAAAALLLLELKLAEEGVTRMADDVGGWLGCGGGA